VVPVNPKDGTTFGYEWVTSIAAIRRLCRVSAPAAAAGVEVASLLARYPRLRDGAHSDNLSDVRFRDRRGA
jgi:hypothetical protein